MIRCIWYCGTGLFWALSLHAQVKIPFHSVQVLDKRPDTAAIYTRLRSAAPPEHYDYPIGEYLRRWSNPGATADLLIRLDRLDVPNGSPRHKHLSFSATAYVQTGADQFVPCLTYQKSYPFRNPTELTTLVEAVVGDFLGKAAGAYRNGPPPSRSFSLEEINALSPYAILNADTLVSGTYATFADFRDDRVKAASVTLTLDSLDQSYNLDSPRFPLPWAVSDGANLYVRWNGTSYTLLTKMGSGFAFRVPLSRSQARFLSMGLVVAPGMSGGDAISLNGGLGGRGHGGGRGGGGRGGSRGGGSGGGGNGLAAALVVVGVALAVTVVAGVAIYIVQDHRERKWKQLSEGYRMGYLDLDREEVSYDWQPYAST